MRFAMTTSIDWNEHTRLIAPPWRRRQPLKTWRRLAQERLLMDQLQCIADLEANAAFNRQQLYWKYEYGHEFYCRA
ncbi:MAG: hypothetical protein MnENMB40S_25080 [Rhizobiaceae bacterium MnEN-MB40S]|nr:MAG: hypothetical protein MnENMB40S_25080 [Rhizobiaceae bacterium MnEN-MB40S]